MRQSFRLIIALILGIGLCSFAVAQDRRGRQAPAAGPSSENSRRANSSVESLNLEEPARFTGVRIVAAENSTRVLMEVSRPVRYEVGRLPADNARQLPPRIYVDILDAKLSMEASEPINVQEDGLKQIRVGQFNHATVRIVLDLTGSRDHTAFLLPEPFRVVVDIQGGNGANSRVSVARGKPVAPIKVPTKSAKPQATGIRKIVLDPGHGGKDPGAIGVGGVAEKDVVLSVAKRLAVKLKKEMGVEVVLTRTDDRFIALEDRTAIANAEDADLFLSLHMNASPNSAARGIETYYLDNTTDEASIRLAARENSTSRKNVSDLQFILSDMTQNMKLEDSVTLAHRLQSSMVSTIGGHMREVKDLGVKKALFYVLVGARMPSVLVEMFFITHSEEGRAMSQSKLQDAMADALYDGIYQYNRSVLATKTL